MNSFAITAALLGLALRLPGAATVTSPSFANSSGSYPFLYGSPIRYQQVYSASDFLNAIPAGGLITQMAFAPADPARYGGSRLTNVQIRFSITKATPSSLSPVFSDNLGGDEAVVFSGQLQLMNDPQTAQFSQIVNISPFLYDPRSGNLLMDVRSEGGTVINTPQGPLFLASSISNNTASEVVAFGPGALDAFSGEVHQDFGLVTQFAITPVPEPSTICFGVVLGATVVGIAVARRGNRRKADALK